METFFRPKNVKLVSEDTVNYQPQREYAASLGHLNPVFGGPELEEIEQLNGMDFKDPVFRDKEIASIYDGVRSSLRSMYDDDFKKRYVEKLFYEGIDNAGVRTALHKDNNETLDLTPESMFNANVFTNDSIHALLVFHNEKFQERAVEFKRSLPAKLNTFFSRIQLLQDIVGKTLDIDTIEKRLLRADIQLVDGLTQRLSDHFGAFEEGTENVYITEQAVENDAKEEEALTHELLHLCSGRTIVSSQNVLYGLLPDITQERIIHNLRNGFRLGIGKYKYNWLNEAITQELTQLLIGRDTDTYLIYRSMKAGLALSGKRLINPELFYAAYFENYDHATSPNQATPARKALMDAISTAYQPGFLPSLDTYISDNTSDKAKGSRDISGFGKALVQLDTDWKVIAQRAENPTL